MAAGVPSSSKASWATLSLLLMFPYGLLSCTKHDDIEKLSLISNKLSLNCIVLILNYDDQTGLKHNKRLQHLSFKGFVGRVNFNLHDADCKRHNFNTTVRIFQFKSENKRNRSNLPCTAVKEACLYSLTHLLGLSIQVLGSSCKSLWGFDRRQGSYRSIPQKQGRCLGRHLIFMRFCQSG